MSELSIVQQIAIYAIPVIFAITVHEAAHGYVASHFGDQTARMAGRLTLNPIKHIDPIGTVVLPLILLAVGSIIFGWAKPVPVEWRNLRKPKQDMAWVALAGPGANLAMMLFWAGFGKLAVSFQHVFKGYTEPMLYMAVAGIGINIVLMVLNMLPLPPLDGSRVVSSFLPPRQEEQYNRLEPYGFIILIILVVTGILGWFLWPVIATIQNFLLGFIS